MVKKRLGHNESCIETNNRFSRHTVYESSVKLKKQVRSIALQTLAFHGEEAEPPRLRLRGLSLSSISRRSRVSSASFHLVFKKSMQNKKILKRVNKDPNDQVKDSLKSLPYRSGLSLAEILMSSLFPFTASQQHYLSLQQGLLCFPPDSRFCMLLLHPSRFVRFHLQF